MGSQFSQHRLAPVDAQAWDPETEYAMHRLREELLAVKQAEHDADANSDDPMACSKSMAVSKVQDMFCESVCA